MSFANKKLSFVLGAVALSVSSWVNAQAGHAHVHGAASMNLVMEGDKVFVEFESPMASIVGFEYKPETRVEKVKVKDAFAALKSDKLFTFEGTSCRLQSIESDLPWEDDGHDSHDHNDHDDHDEHDHDEHDHDEHDHDEHDHDEHDHDEHDHDEHDHDEHDHDKHDHDKHDHDKQDHDEHDHDKHDHDEHNHDEHNHDKHDHDEHDHDEHDHDKHDHEKETHSDVALNYRFACKGDVKALKLGHFEQFPLMDNLKVQWIGEGGQGAESLSKSKSTITF